MEVEKKESYLLIICVPVESSNNMNNCLIYDKTSSI